MKRSEMLLKIQEMLVEAPDSLEDAANQILTRIEKVGMKPPYSNKMFQRDAKIYIDADGCQWEPENE